jgi:hypothetical protein
MRDPATQDDHHIEPGHFSLGVVPFKADSGAKYLHISHNIYVVIHEGE